MMRALPALPVLHLALACSVLALSAPVAAQNLPAWAEPAPLPPPPPALFGPGVPPPCPPTGCTTTPTQVPVDGGLGLLALAGAGYAARRLRRRP